MYAKFRKLHTNAKIKSSEDGNNLGLKDLVYAYIKSTSLDNLKTNR